MSLSTSDVLEAYRADLANAGKTGFGPNDGTWLQLGVILQRALSLPSSDRPVYIATAATTLVGSLPAGAFADALRTLVTTERIEDDSWNAPLCTAVQVIANAAEDAGAFAVATSLIDFARALVGLAEFRLHGRLLAQQARIIRKVGELDVATELYDDVADLAQTHGDSELKARAHLGKGVIARIRGNYPVARREFLAVVACPENTEPLRELHGYARHGLLIASAVAGDFETALRHGWIAIGLATNDEQRAELLVNLASVCLDAGHPRAALNGFLQALGKTQISRVRLPAFGSAARAAARLDEPEAVKDLVDAGMRLVTPAGNEYEIADMLREFAEAYADLGEPTESTRFKVEALKRARRGHLFEIIHRLESMSSTKTPAPSPAPLAADALGVTTQLASADSHRLLAEAVSTAH